MVRELNCYINGAWTKPKGNEMFDVINPATEEVTTKLRMGNKKDVDMAVTAAKEAFKTYSLTTRDERSDILSRISINLEKRKDELARAITLEMGTPGWLAEDAQAPAGINHVKTALDVLKTFEFEKNTNVSLIKKVPIGVCGMITPWNWPVAVIMSKLAPALAVGCTVVLKPSEYSPFSAQIIAEALHESNLPKGVFNMVYGTGEVVGRAISGHPDIECVSFTGSYAGGVDVAINAAPTVKRVIQELGGKGPNIILPSSDIKQKVKEGFKGLLVNAGQSCSAPSRMIVPKSEYDKAKEAILEIKDEVQPGSPYSGALYGPLVNKRQYERVQGYIKSGIDEGATLVIGGLGKPKGLEKGYYVKPTVFMDTKPDMKIVKEEIFGPVLVIQGYDTVDEAIELANNTAYGLVGYVQGDDFEEVKMVADKIFAGQVYLNDAGFELDDEIAPFGGVKFSGNGREHGEYAFDGYLELKSLVGYYPRKG